MGIMMIKLYFSVLVVILYAQHALVQILMTAKLVLKAISFSQISLNVPKIFAPANTIKTLTPKLAKNATKLVRCVLVLKL